MHVKELRKKLQLDCIKTVYKSGYRMEWYCEDKK
jgi:DNA-binding response OmpR family regulator